MADRLTDAQMEHVRWLEARAVSRATPVTRGELVEILRDMEHESMASNVAADYARRWGL
jgi:hypothetical protein